MAEPKIEESHDPGARVRALFNMGSSVEVDQNIPVKRYFRSGVEMIRMANVYLDEGQLESAFVLFSKYTTLFVAKLPKHPGYKDETLRKDKVTNKKKLEVVFQTAEELKKKLKTKYEKELKEWLVVERKRLAIIAEQEEIERKRQAQEELKRQEEQKRLEDEAREREDLEVARVLQEEEKIIALEREKQRQLQIQKQRELERELERQKDIERQRELEKQAEQLSVSKDVAGTIAGLGVTRRDESVPSSIPSRPSTAPPQGYVPTPISPYGAVVPPSVINAYNANFISSNIKPLPQPLPPIGSTTPKGILKDEPSATSITREPPQVDRSLKVDRSSKPSIEPDIDLNRAAANRYGLRPVVIPQDVTQKFLNLALPNTNKNVETCGILAGKLAQNAFHITHIIIPKQSGTSDSCTTVNEEEIFDYQDNYDLITIGWIHTHPSQTAFLSSVDLHTHCSYQLMMPEAIAIVCAPKHRETGFFLLTPDHGLKLIADCRQQGFHPHPKHPPLFEECSHITITSSKSVNIADLRH
ncbi:STAM-binding protein-like A [Glandiceps talaboti]